MSVTEVVQLVVLAGLPGSGKTTLATWLSTEHGYTIASRDVIRMAMFPRCRFTAGEKDAAFRAMKRAIAVMLEMGMTVVTDGICFSSSEQLQEVLDLATAAGVSARIIHCHVPVDVAQARVEHDRSVDDTVPADRDADLVQVVFDRFEPLPASALVVDTAQELPVIRRAVIAILGLGD
jgi:predicted kinase